ncbi:MAG TPA: hemolysin family protein [Spirochaetota bacterium]|nr:hemolysin family protein [Spirochaetota bacterium]HOS33755.1 hemolysin family protein [Spirochaetota bacterium]HOS56758.1 hemolysin family protein [Spirochaetota bacterium]HPK62514.1 hemolysin family protein [Spirochaetota bacterium]HPY86451.1 hemolysin family protein [Spirochaetota bacterium]
MIDSNFIILPIFLALSAFFSCSETSLFSLNSLKVEDLRRKYKIRGKMIFDLLEHPQKLLVTILICNTTVNTSATLAASNIFTKYIPQADYILVVIVMTLLILIIGEVTPKTLAIKVAPKIALIVAPILYFLTIILTPFIFIFRNISKFLVFIFSHIQYRNVTESNEYKSEEMIEIIKQSHKEGILNKEESILLGNVISFPNSEVWRIMRPRNEIFSFSTTTKMSELRQKIKEKKYSRTPVWEDEEENIIGILNVRELVKSDCNKEDILENYKSILAKPFFIPETMKVDNLLKTLQSSKQHLAIVIDEYGSVSGLVTMEDVIESIIGEVVDKEEIVPLFYKYNPSMIEVESKLELAEFNEIFKVNLKSDSAATIGGYLLEKVKRIPKGGELFKFDNLQFKVIGAEPNKIEKILITKVRKLKKKNELFDLNATIAEG